MRWEKIEPGANVTHSVIVRPRTYGTFNYTAAQVTYYPGEGAKEAKVGYTTSPGEGSSIILQLLGSNSLKPSLSRTHLPLQGLRPALQLEDLHLGGLRPACAANHLGAFRHLVETIDEVRAPEGQQEDPVGIVVRGEGGGMGDKSHFGLVYLSYTLL